MRPEDPRSAAMRPEDPRSALVELVRTRIHSLRPKLLDLTRRNPLLSTKFSTRSTSHVRVVDELPDVLLSQLTTGQRMRLVGLPALDDEPRDERTREFQNALSNARLTEEQYLEAVQQIDQSSEQAVELSRKAERALRDRLRMVLGMKPSLPASTGRSRAARSGRSPIRENRAAGTLSTLIKSRRSIPPKSLTTRITTS
jgi:hypothetical protein